jgi:hypothetical protein
MRCTRRSGVVETMPFSAATDNLNLAFAVYRTFFFVSSASVPNARPTLQKPHTDFKAGHKFAHYPFCQGLRKL